MNDKITFSARASLVALGVHFQEMGVWRVVADHVRIRQKVLKHTPLEKLLDCLINILAGGTGLVEINTRVRPDQAVQRAFGRSACADQSTISDTLNVCTTENVEQMRAALRQILRQYGQSTRHPYQQQWQLLDVDTTGLPAGRQGEGVTKGYFAKQKNRRGRQLGRVLATPYEEVVVERLYEGKRQLNSCLQELVVAAQEVLELDANRRPRTIVRVDAGGGEDKDVNWLLSQGYHLVIKVKSWRRAEKLAATIDQWHVDPKLSNRAAAWIAQPHRYGRATRQLAVRTQKADGCYTFHVLVMTLSDEMLFQLLDWSLPVPDDGCHSAWAALYLYDRRSGGIETQNRGDKQGLGLARRNKQRFAAQEMLVLLAQLAHNLVIWTRNDLAQADRRLQKYGIQRTVRDALHISGTIHLDPTDHVQQITLNQHHPLARAFVAAFTMPDELSLNLGQI